MSRYLLDTHTVLWWFTNSEQLSATARELLADETVECWISGASAWEVATKARIGKLPHVPTVTRDYSVLAARNGFQELAVSSNHGLLAGSIQHPHRDPFDRVLAAQSILESMPVLTMDPALAALGAKTIW